MEARAIRTGPALAAESPPDREGRTPLAKDAARLIQAWEHSHNDDAEATGRRLFHARLAKALLPLGTRALDERNERKLAASAGAQISTEVTP